jgi:copper chaperone CopZ
VESVRVDFDEKTATVTCTGSCDRQALIAALEQRGYGGKVQ